MTISCVGPMIATIASASTSAVHHQDGLPGGRKLGGRGGHGVARMRVGWKLLAVEAIEEGARPTHSEPGHRAERDADGVERDHVAE